MTKIDMGWTEGGINGKIVGEYEPDPEYFFEVSSTSDGDIYLRFKGNKSEIAERVASNRVDNRYVGRKCALMIAHAILESIAKANDIEEGIDMWGGNAPL